MPPTSASPPESTQSNSVSSLLDRPVEQRLREYKYRCAQAIVFGIPVLVLQWYGRSLGGSVQEAQRWVAILQALLAGWVTYVGATGMLVEGMMLLVAMRKLSVDLLVAALTAMLYLYSLISVAGVLFRGHLFYTPTLFHVAVLLLAIWCGWRWWRSALLL